MKVSPREYCTWSGTGTETVKRWVLRRDRKTSNECAEVTCWSKLFQIRAAATGKARSPTVDIVEWWRRGRTESLTSLDVRHFIDTVHRRGMTVQTPECTRTRGEHIWKQSALKPSASGVGERADREERRRKDEASSGVHHWLEPWQKMRWYAGQSCTTA